MHFDPNETYVHLNPDGSAELIAGGERFWSLPEPELDRFGQGWLITEFECSADWPTWEMHPHGDEFVYLLAGEAIFQLQSEGVITSVPLRGRGAVVVPRGVWHTAKVSAPSRMLFVTLGAGTQLRAANEGDAQPS